MARCQAGPGGDEADVPVRNGNSDTGRHQSAFSGCQHSPGAGAQIHAGIPRPGVVGQRKLGIELFDEYLQAVHVRDKSTGVSK